MMHFLEFIDQCILVENARGQKDANGRLQFFSTTFNYINCQLVGCSLHGQQEGK
jgi:hypothetical protein